MPVSSVVPRIFLCLSAGCFIPSCGGRYGTPENGTANDGTDSSLDSDSNAGGDPGSDTTSGMGSAGSDTETGTDNHAATGEDTKKDTDTDTETGSNTGDVSGTGGDKHVDPVDPDKLYSERGKNIAVSQIKCGGNNPGSLINVNNARVEGGPYAKYGIDTNTTLHTLCGSGIKASAFDKNKRWYQKDGKTQIFRVFKGERDISRGRTEFDSRHRWGKGDGWQEWVGRYTIIKPKGGAIFQIKNNNGKTNSRFHWPMQLQMSNRGDIMLKDRYSDSVVIAPNVLGKPTDIKVRDNFGTYQVYVNGRKVAEKNYAKNTPKGSVQRFRWGLYTGDGKIRSDGMLFISHATVNPR